jgi:YkoY family integral membrane protein
MDIIHTFFGNDIKAGVLIILNLILIESLLSVDNAAVLATMVMDLPTEQRKKALKYGIFGAYFFRGICLLLASWLVKVWWLKPLGGFYLIYLCIDYFITKHKTNQKDLEDDGIDNDSVKKEENRIFKWLKRFVTPFWATVALVELMDLAFSIDNVFAAVAFTDNIYLICTGVFIGILTMRFVAQAFVKLMEKFPFLETAAYIVIGILGLKLSLSVICHFLENSKFCFYFESERADLFLSLITVLVFVLPVLFNLLSTKKNKLIK